MKWFLWSLRKLLFIPQPRVTKLDALKIASREAERRGWPFNDVRVIEELRNWVIWLGADMRSPPWLVISQQTGEVVRSGCPPM